MVASTFPALAALKTLMGSADEEEDADDDGTEVQVKVEESSDSYALAARGSNLPYRPA